jgi:serine/threonine protein kinase
MIAVPTSASSKVVSLRDVINSPRRLDELGIARVIASAAEVVHKLQKGGQPVGTLTPDAIAIGDDGEIAVQAGAAKAGYVAPERLRGEAGDRRSDVFSLGAILWEALAHEPLFGGEIEGEIKAAVLEGEYRAAQELNANVPPELEAICVKATMLEPDDRLSTAKELHEAIEAYLDGDRDLSARKEAARRHAERAKELAEEKDDARREAALREPSGRASSWSRATGSSRSATPICRSSCCPTTGPGTGPTSCSRPRTKPSARPPTHSCGACCGRARPEQPRQASATSSVSTPILPTFDAPPGLPRGASRPGSGSMKNRLLSAMCGSFSSLTRRSWAIASTGHTGSHAPQSMHSLGLM